MIISSHFILLCRCHFFIAFGIFRIFFIRPTHQSFYLNLFFSTQFSLKSLGILEWLIVWFCTAELVPKIGQVKNYPEISLLATTSFIGKRRYSTVIPCYFWHTLMVSSVLFTVIWPVFSFISIFRFAINQKSRLWNLSIGLHSFCSPLKNLKRIAEPCWMIWWDQPRFRRRPREWFLSPAVWASSRTGRIATAAQGVENGASPRPPALPAPLTCLDLNSPLLN